MSAEPLFETIEDRIAAQDPIPTPKRRGRPPKIDPLTGERATPARKRGPRKPSAPTRKRAPRGPRSLRPEIGAALTMLNAVLIVSPLGTRPVEAIGDPAIMPERIGDELDAAEIDALASAIDAQCKRSPRFRAYVESVLTVGSGGTLLTVLAIIAARRAARHGILPAQVDMIGGMALSSDIGALANIEPVPPSTAPDPDTGETPPKPLPFDYEPGVGGAMEG